MQYAIGPASDRPWQLPAEFVKRSPLDSAYPGTMSDDERERLLAECLENYHRRRVLREPVEPGEYLAQLGEGFQEFIDLLAAESVIDQVIDPQITDDIFPRPFGNYTLLRELGGGAMGLVYEAVDRNLGRKVALKILRTGFDTEPLALERFRREARACAQISTLR